MQKSIYIEEKDSLLVCPIGTTPDEARLRVRLKAQIENGLIQDSDIHTDKVSGIRKYGLANHWKVSKQKMIEVSHSLKIGLIYKASINRQT